MDWNIMLIILLTFLLRLFSPGHGSQEEERLVRDLFRGYNKLIRPVQNMTQKVEVAFGLAFIQLINVNEKNQIMKSNVWLRFVWNDYQLQWDEADYGGISVLRLPPDKVWKPDIVLFNNADGNYEVRYKSNVLIYPDGEVLWVPPAIYQSSCTIDVTYFPFDQQTCIMKFGSWTFTGDQVSLTLYNNKDYVDLSDYWKSGTWDIIEVPAYLNIHNDTLPTETDISFYITIRRKTLFYTVNLILPTVLISFLCVLVFYLPAEAGEKVTLGISILLSLVVFLLLVSKILPPTSLVLPLIAKYLLFTFIMNTVSILVTVVIINWNFRGPRTHSMPNWIRVLFLKYLPIVLFMRRPKKTRLRWMMEMPGQSRRIPPPHPSYCPPPTNNGTSSSSNNNNNTSNNNHQHHPHPDSSSSPLSGGIKLTAPNAPLPPPPPVSPPSSDLIKNKIEIMELNDMQNTNSSQPQPPNSSSHIHHPTCKLNQSHQGSFDDEEVEDEDDDLTTSPTGRGNHHHPPPPHHHQHLHHHHHHHLDEEEDQAQQHPPPPHHRGGRRNSDEDDGSEAFLSPEAYRATQAVEFIAEHLRNEDEYLQIREDWKFVAMVVDRMQLYVFFIVTTVGTVGILMDAPHIFEYVDQDKIIDIYKGK
ncbi:acetylcholine receptor subunit beta-like 1 [Lepeophtheirus salmonis]|uniref:Nicotinic acetylcholine receptor beta-1 subunit n=1 Tax=Lepeophtheirus salmonis TaxID=72036 RepID=A0A7S5PZ05_LEPSM|nr:acetylcholine receptor subunit beta-like 1 [Lepeophtheirus salmonis]QHU23859.1 nicotinic acetylcholine receptor beta-1 subunit [Lepeophtheirus salmonis]